jgi:uncharacterized protein (DUF1015 family)
VAAVPYDVVDTEEARSLAAGNPLSFLRVSRPEIDFPAGVNMYAAEVYARGAESFARFQAQGALKQDASPGLFVYAQRLGSHVQHGIVACLDTLEYEADIVRKHEKTRVDKENDRVRHLESIHAQSGPVFVAYRDEAAIDRMTARAEESEPLFRFTDADGIEHAGWRLEDPAAATAAFAQIPHCYIADGHHRAAAAARVAARMRSEGHVDGEWRWFLAVLFPASQLRIFSINRVLTHLNNLSPDDFLSAVRARFKLSERADGEPQAVGDVRMFVKGRWYALAWDTDVAADPVARLDVSVLQDRLLGPILGVADPRTDARLQFISGFLGGEELARRVTRGEAQIGFSMYPVTIDQVMAVSDAGRIMPPKSTWFAPKLRSGLFVHLI